MKLKNCKVHVLTLAVAFLAFTSLMVRAFPFLAIAVQSISKDEALEILMKEIIKPSNTTYRLGAYMLSKPLQIGDIISSLSGVKYSITESTWFIFIDDKPCAAYEHNVRYVFMNISTGNYVIVDETWPPYINDMSMWNTTGLNRGELVEIFPILSEPWPMPVYDYTALSPPLGDYGDAPDGQKAYYAVDGSFPTLFNTTNSKFGRPGAHTLNVGREMLGVSVSTEVDANDLADPDGVQNLVDADSDERMFLIIENMTAQLVFDVSVNASAPELTRYINVLLDFDQSGNWSGSVNGKEWAIVNMGVDVSSGTTETIITSNFPWGYNEVSPVWMRVALTREEVNETLFGLQGWDGSGQFEYGEIEDSLVFLMDCPPPGNLSVWWPPKSGSPPGGQGSGENPRPRPKPLPDPMPKGPEKGPCEYPIKYYAVIINAGDNNKDQATMMKGSAERMRAVIVAQSYDDIEFVSTDDCKNEKNIKDALEGLKDKVNCGDRVFIYICGHGREAPSGIVLYKNRKKTGEDITPDELETWLDLPECDGHCCLEKGVCCHVSVVIDSCFADNFKGLRRKGRVVATSTTDQPAWGYTKGDLDYTRGFDLDLRNSAADTNHDGFVDVKEAHESAKELVDKFNDKYNQEPPQTPNIDGQWCECICPRPPCIGGEIVLINLHTHKVTLLETWITPILAISTAITVASIVTIYKRRHKTRKPSK